MLRRYSSNGLLTVRLPTTVTTIGSHNCDIVIQAKNVAPIHASIEYNPVTKTYWIKDHSLTSNTKLNGDIIYGQAELSNGDLVSFGDSQPLVFENEQLVPIKQPLTHDYHRLCTEKNTERTQLPQLRNTRSTKNSRVTSGAPRQGRSNQSMKKEKRSDSVDTALQKSARKSNRSSARDSPPSTATDSPVEMVANGNEFRLTGNPTRIRSVGNHLLQRVVRLQSELARKDSEIRELRTGAGQIGYDQLIGYRSMLEQSEKEKERLKDLLAQAATVPVPQRAPQLNSIRQSSYDVPMFEEIRSIRSADSGILQTTRDAQTEVEVYRAFIRTMAIELQAFNDRVLRQPLRDYSDVFQAIVRALEEPFAYKLLEIESQCESYLHELGFGDPQIAKLQHVLRDEKIHKIHLMCTQLEVLLPVVRDAAAIARESIRVCTVFTQWSRQVGDEIRTNGLSSDTLLAAIDSLKEQFTANRMSRHWLPPSLTPLLRSAALEFKRKVEDQPKEEIEDSVKNVEKQTDVETDSDGSVKKSGRYSERQISTLDTAPDPQGEEIQVLKKELEAVTFGKHELQLSIDEIKESFQMELSFEKNMNAGLHDEIFQLKEALTKADAKAYALQMENDKLRGTVDQDKANQEREFGNEMNILHERLESVSEPLHRIKRSLSGLSNEETHSEMEHSDVGEEELASQKLAPIPENEVDSSGKQESMDMVEEPVEKSMLPRLTMSPPEETREVDRDPDVDSIHKVERVEDSEKPREDIDEGETDTQTKLQEEIEQVGNVENAKEHKKDGEVVISEESPEVAAKTEEEVDAPEEVVQEAQKPNDIAEVTSQKAENHEEAEAEATQNKRSVGPYSALSSTRTTPPIAEETEEEDEGEVTESEKKEESAERTQMLETAEMAQIAAFGRQDTAAPENDLLDVEKLEDDVATEATDTAAESNNLGKSEGAEKLKDEEVSADTEETVDNIGLNKDEMLAKLEDEAEPEHPEDRMKREVGAEDVEHPEEGTETEASAEDVEDSENKGENLRLHELSSLGNSAETVIEVVQHRAEHPEERADDVEEEERADNQIVQEDHDADKHNVEDLETTAETESPAEVKEESPSTTAPEAANDADDEKSMGDGENVENTEEKNVRHEESGETAIVNDEITPELPSDNTVIDLHAEVKDTEDPPQTVESPIEKREFIPEKLVFTDSPAITERSGAPGEEDTVVRKTSTVSSSGESGDGSRRKKKQATMPPEDITHEVVDEEEIVRILTARRVPESDAESVRGLETQSIKDAETQSIKEAEMQSIQGSDAQTFRDTESKQAEHKLLLTERSDEFLDEGNSVESAERTGRTGETGGSTGRLAGDESSDVSAVGTPSAIRPTTAEGAGERMVSKEEVEEVSRERVQESTVEDNLSARDSFPVESDKAETDRTEEGGEMSETSNTENSLQDLSILSDQMKELYNIKENLEEKLGAWNPDISYHNCEKPGKSVHEQLASAEQAFHTLAVYLMELLEQPKSSVPESFGSDEIVRRTQREQTVQDILEALHKMLLREEAKSPAAQKMGMYKRGKKYNMIPKPRSEHSHPSVETDLDVAYHSTSDAGSEIGSTIGEEMTDSERRRDSKDNGEREKGQTVAEEMRQLKSTADKAAGPSVATVYFHEQPKSIAEIPYSSHIQSHINTATRRPGYHPGSVLRLKTINFKPPTRKKKEKKKSTKLPPIVQPRMKF